MANEIRLTDRMSVQKGSTKIATPPLNLTADWTGEHWYGASIDIEASEVAITIPANIAVIGWCWFHNASDTENLELSTGTGGTFLAHIFAILQPGEYARFPGGPNTIHCRNESEYGITGKLEVTVLER